MKRVYLDNNATTPCDPRVVETMVPYFLTLTFGRGRQPQQQHADNLRRRHIGGLAVFFRGIQHFQRPQQFVAAPV